MYKKLIEKKKEQVENIENKNLKINTGMKNSKGITLISLVVTIVILIILATVAISVILGRNSLLDNAETGKKAYAKEEARERLQVVLADAFVDKHTNRDEYNENEYLDEYVKQREPEVSIAGNEIGLNGHVFELDRSVPQLGDYIGEEGNLPAKIGSVKVISKTETSGTVEVTAVRTEGVQYRYSIKELGQGDESYVQKAEKTENTNEFTGLQATKKYVIKVELIKDGEIVDTDDSTVLLIGKLESGVVKFEDPVWNNGTASVKITTQEQGYKLQYQIDKTDASGWTDVTSGSIINGLKVNQVVFGRLWNGIDESEPASVNILDTVGPVIKEIKEIEVTETTIKVGVEAEDLESGIKKIEYAINEGEYITGDTETATEYIFEGLIQSTEYTIKVKVTDNADNTVEANTTIQTDGEKFSDIYEETTQYTDSEGNTAWIPGGFAVGIDEDINKISGGLVITDAIDAEHNSIGNQFVWIPTGEYKTATEEIKTNELTRRQWGAANVVQKPTPVSGDTGIASGSYYYYGEGNSSSIASGTIGAFLESAKPVNEGGKGGFYIGRYEQGEGNVCKAGVNVYTNITRNTANTNAKAMYSGKSEIKATSELISSYAWDTALNFICQTNEEGYLLATTTSSSYGNIGTGSKKQTGKYEADNYSNIHDFLGNCREWTTEYWSDSDYPCVLRGGVYGGGSSYAARRASDFVTGDSNDDVGFRTQIYVK